jgi:RalA-binding protein 1
LKLNPPKPEVNVTNNIIDASDSEYEDDPESARSDYLDRGRRKTREEDDRQREIQAQQEEEHRSRSKKDKQSKSKAPVEKMDIPAAVPATVATDPAYDMRTQAAIFQPTANPAEIVRNRAVSDATQMLRNNIAPSLMSPGLPMSPRPGDRPPNSPMPRALNTISNSIPMSPKAGMPAGLPLSPRAPRHAIPLPPQTPVSMMSPHLDRAKAYHQQMQPHPHSLASVTESGLRPPGDERSPDRERSSLSSDPSVFTPGEVYRGFVTEQYPGLLLPPNPLASIFVKTASSRMRPSRASFIAPKTADENPVLTLSVHERSDGKQLWQVEKTFAALASLDQQVRSMCSIRDRLPEKALFAGHAPAKIDARRMALNHYLDRMLDAITEEKAAMVVCKFLSSDAIGGDSGDYFGSLNSSRPDSPVAQLRPNRAGYLTKRGKNFGGWKARYFVLDGPNLKYFEGPGGAHMGSIKLQNAQIGKQSSNAAQNANEDEDNQFRHAFLILEPKKKDSTSLVRHVLCAESDEERDAWVDALLQYVDFKDDEEPHIARQAQVLKTEAAPRSPRPQKSMSDLSKAGSTHSTQTRSVDQVRAVNYSETVAGDAPVMGQAPLSPRPTQTPSPPYDQLTNGQEQPYPTISAPTNLQVIQNAGDWGMRPPPTPGSRDKKRSVFQLPFTRGRSSSELQGGDKAMSSGLAPERPYASKVIFGVPLAEAVAAAQPADVSTELPAVVYRCIEYLTYRNAIAEEGIFRLSGSNTVIRSLKDRFNAEGDVNLVTDDIYYDIHAVASLLKLYLRELPASILTRDLHLDFLHTLDIAGNDKVAVLNALVNKLPRPNRALLEALSAFMLLIVNNVGVNKMSVRNRKFSIIQTLPNHC